MRRFWLKAAPWQAAGLLLHGTLGLTGSIEQAIFQAAPNPVLLGLWNCVVLLLTTPLAALIWLLAAAHALRLTPQPSIPITMPARFIVALCQGWLPCALLAVHGLVTLLALQHKVLGYASGGVVALPVSFVLAEPLRLCAGMVWVVALLAVCYPRQLPALSALILLFCAETFRYSLQMVAPSSRAFESLPPPSSSWVVLLCGISAALCMLSGLRALAHGYRVSAWLAFAPLLLSFATIIIVNPLLPPSSRRAAPNREFAWQQELARLGPLAVYLPASGSLTRHREQLTGHVTFFGKYSLQGGPLWPLAGLAANLVWLAALVVLAAGALREPEPSG